MGKGTVVISAILSISSRLYLIFPLRKLFILSMKAIRHHMKMIVFFVTFSQVLGGSKLVYFIQRT